MWISKLNLITFEENNLEKNLVRYIITPFNVLILNNLH